MTYLIVSQYFRPESFIINEMASELAAKGHRIIVLTGQPNYPEGKVFSGFKWWKLKTTFEQENLQVIRLPLLPRGHKSALGLVFNYLSYVFFATLLGPFFIFNKKIDSIFVFGVSPITQAIPAILFSWMKNVRVVVWVLDLWPESLSATGYVKNKKILAVVDAMVRWIYNRVDVLLGTSEAVVQKLKSGNYNTTIDYFPNSIKESQDVTAVARTDESGRLAELMAQMKDSFSVVFAGNIGEAQSIDTIIKAAQKIISTDKKIKLFIIGSGSKLADLIQAKEKLQLDQLILPGRFDQKQIQAIYQKADALLITFSNDPLFDLMIPLRLQSYLAAGKPIIGSVNGESARIIRLAKAGLVTPSEDAQGLAESIIKLYNEPPEVRASFGANGRQFFLDHYEMGQQVKRLENFLNGP